MTLAGLALRNLRRRPIRTCLSILGIALSVGSALALITLSHSIQDSTREGMDEMGDDLVVMQKGASDIFGGFLPEQTIERVAAIPGVVRVSGELMMFAPSGERNVPTLGWPDASYLWKKVPLREGAVPAAGERRVAVLGETAAATLNKKVGDTVELLNESFRVIGIANYTTVVNRGLFLVPLTDLQEASYRPRQVTMIHVNVERVSGAPQNLAKVRSAIEALGGVTASTANEVLNSDRNFAILNAVSLAVSIIAVTVGALSVLNALIMATQERTREIGIFSAIGWSGQRIMTSIVVEGLLMCAIGCVLGVLLSFLAAFIFPHVPTIGNLISFKPSIWLITPVLAATCALCLLGSLFPAWRAVRMAPAEALRRL
jgi:putative ABC transport system permease protein